MSYRGQYKKDHYQMVELKFNKSETCDVCHGSGTIKDGTCHLVMEQVLYEKVINRFTAGIIYGISRN